tara:strand:- start:174979 stop:176025 length:1047 start_codon:yes stop_codon:yes gene_type:complete
MNINDITATLLDESSSSSALQQALDAFVKQCSDVSGIQANRSFDAWAGDTLLDTGVAINPQAAAHCVLDYQRSAVFIRGIYAAIETLREGFPDTQLDILYAGCGPFATLLLPLLCKFSPGDLKIHLLDIHQRSLESVNLLMTHYGFTGHDFYTIQGDACHYQHGVNPHLIIAETMQKSLEQEPQFAVTANLAPQLGPMGIFIPQRIEVSLCLADLDDERAVYGASPRMDPSLAEMEARRFPIETIFTLSPGEVSNQLRHAQKNSHRSKLELDLTVVEIPSIKDIVRFDAALFTRIAVFGPYHLGDYESEITLPQKCPEFAPLAGGERFRISYQLGSYPRFNFERLGTP